MGKKDKVIKKTESVPQKSAAVNPFLMKIILVLAAVFIYGRTINFEFTMDDDLFYLKHASVQKGPSALSEFFEYGSLNKFDGTTGLQPYRPITLFVFSLQKFFFENSPQWAHIVNIFLYALTLIVLFSLLRALLTGFNPVVILLLGLLYGAHPLHTEVIPSVKSMDELLAALFGFASWYFFALGNKKPYAGWIGLIGGGLFYFLALFSKENAIAFLPIIPLSMYMLQQKKVKEILPVILILAGLTGLFLFLRHAAIGNEVTNNQVSVLDNILAGATSLAESTATKAVILFHYLKLLFVPWPLSYDYSYNQIPVSDWSNPLAIAGLLLNLGLLVLAAVYFRKKPLLSFWILFYFFSSAPTNNLFIMNGATLAERFLFIPSLAGCFLFLIPLSFLTKTDINTLNGDKKIVFTSSLVAIILVFSVLSTKRAGVWESNLVLFEDGVKTAPNSSRAYYNVATAYMKIYDNNSGEGDPKEYLQKAMDNFSKSVDIFPKNVQAHYNKAICYSKLGDTARSIEEYKQTIALNPKDIPSLTNLGNIYAQLTMYDTARVYFERAYSLNRTNKITLKKMENVYFFIGFNFYRQGENDSALVYWNKSLDFNPNNIFCLNNMTVIYINRKQFEQANTFAQRALRLDAYNRKAVENMMRVYIGYKNYEAAVSLGKEGLKKQPGSVEILSALADANGLAGNFSESDKYRNMINSINQKR